MTVLEQLRMAKSMQLNLLRMAEKIERAGWKIGANSMSTKKLRLAFSCVRDAEGYLQDFMREVYKQNAEDRVMAMKKEIIDAPE